MAEVFHFMKQFQADKPHPRDYLLKPPDYTHKYTMTIFCSKLDKQTDGLVFIQQYINSGVETPYKEL